MHRWLLDLMDVPDSEEERVVAATRDVAAALAAWAAPYGIFEAVRFPGIALSVAAAAPWLGAADMALLARIPAWIYAIDDAYDRRMLTPEEREARVLRYARVAAGRPGSAVEGDAYAASLAEVTGCLAARPLWEALRREWAGSCRRMLRGMAFECETADRCRSGQAPPSFRRYIDHAVNSIGVPMFLAGAWLIDGDPRTGAALPELRALARCAARAIRLANDLRTHEKECAEGNLNALMLVRGAPAEAAAAGVRRRLRLAARRVTERGRALGGLRAAALALRVTRFSVALYAQSDFHTLPPAQILGAAPAGGSDRGGRAPPPRQLDQRPLPWSH